MSFSSDLKKFADKTERNAEKVFRGTALSIFSHVIKRTPVDTGRLRGNWQANINRPAQGTTSINDKTGSQAISSAATESMQAKLGDSIYLVNNLPYAKVIEDGSSKQAPQGMVKVTVAEFTREVEKQARLLK